MRWNSVRALEVRLGLPLMLMLMLGCHRGAEPSPTPPAPDTSAAAAPPAPEPNLDEANATDTDDAHDTRVMPPSEHSAGVDEDLRHEPRRPHERVLVAPPPRREGPADGFGSAHGEPLPERYGCAGFGQIGLRPTSFASLTRERDYLDAELAKMQRELRELRQCMRQWSRDIESARATRPVPRARLAQLKEERAATQRAIDTVKERRDDTKARRDAIQAELDRRRELIQSGVCPAEPCPPGTTPNSETLPAPTPKLYRSL